MCSKEVEYELDGCTVIGKDEQEDFIDRLKYSGK